MDKIKVIIIDDELSARNVLNNLLELSFPFIDVVEKAKDLLEGVTLIKKHQPDLVFLDVEMPNYAGYEIVRFFDEINFQIIFVTAYNQYAINAFEINAIDYLLKPIDRQRLKSAVEKAHLKVTEGKAIANYKALLKKIKNKENQTITLSESGNKHLITIDSIIAINAQGAYSKVFFEDKKILVSKNIGTLKNELGNHECFIRTHKSWIINQNHILSYQKGNLTVELKNKITAKVSRNQKNEFEANL